MKVVKRKKKKKEQPTITTVFKFKRYFRECKIIQRTGVESVMVM